MNRDRVPTQVCSMRDGRDNFSAILGLFLTEGGFVSSPAVRILYQIYLPARKSMKWSAAEAASLALVGLAHRRGMRRFPVVLGLK